MLSQKSTMKTKLENMYLQKRISYGYRKVINMMLLSGVISIIAIGILFANMMNYVNNVNAADQAVKTCRININTAARNIREMALNDDESTYDSERASRDRRYTDECFTRHRCHYRGSLYRI